ncbi:MAG: hypothetical protein H6P95_259 [Candidatus Aminicenantes bacterium]|nr:hypothetical protein [Candidatus Aminicenantes bacterium]
MNAQRPRYFRPALIAGAVAGLLSGLPVVSAANCLCCLWIVGGAAWAVKLLARETPGLLTSGDGAVVGALTGLVAAVVQAVVSLPFRSFDPEQMQRVMDWLGNLGLNVPPNVADEAARTSSAFMSPGWSVLLLAFSAVTLTIIGVIGGIIGVAIFAKKASRPLPPPPPAIPAPPPPPGPPDAS